MMKMKKISKYSVGAACAIVILGIIITFSFNGCKNFGVPDYQLQITISNGVQGTPATGKYTYKDLATIDYSYTPLDTAQTVEVLVNGSRWATQGTVTMYADISLVAQIMDIRGAWLITISPSTSTTDKTIKYDTVFSGGDTLSGIFTAVNQDDKAVHNGSWKMEKKNDGSTTVTITFTDWKDYVLTGTASTMSGTWTGETKSGNWSATRQQ
jgi:hypothetical protein